MVLKNLIIGTTTTSKKFFKLIRSYNSAVAFVSFGATFDKLFSQGPSVIRICGQIYHNTYALHPNEGDLRKFSQLYIIDNVDANRMRLISHPACSEDLLKQIDSIIRKSNRYVAVWEMVHVVEFEEFNRCMSNTYIPREEKMLFTRNDNFDKNHFFFFFL